MEKAEKAIVRIQIFDGSLDEGGKVASGTGFVLEKKNIIATNFHVVDRLDDPSRVIVITTRTGKKLSFKRILKLSGRMDMAFLEVEGYEGPVLKLAEISSSFLDTTYTMGFPGGKFLKRIGKNFQKKGMVFSTSTINFLEKGDGNSGGPVFNTQGKVIGILNIGAEHSFSGFPLEHIRELLNQPDLPSLKADHLIKRETAHLLRLAAQGDAQAQYILGVSIGGRIKKDILSPTFNALAKTSFQWILKAAEQGHTSAQSQLGNYFAEGEGGVPRDPLSALKWWDMAVRQGDTQTMYNLGLLLYKETEIQDKPRAFDLFLQAAKQGHNSQAKFYLGTMLLKGDGVEQNLKEAFKWFQEAAKQGHPDSQEMAGLMLFEGKGVRQDYGQALKWFLQAAEQGISKANQMVAAMFNAKMGVAQNEAKVLEWELQELAQAGSPESKYRMGMVFREGWSVEKNEEKAFEWFHKAAMEQYAPAQLQTGLMFMEGTGVAQNEIIGATLISFAVEDLKKTKYDSPRIRKDMMQQIEIFSKKNPDALNILRNMEINLSSDQCEGSFSTPKSS